MRYKVIRTLINLLVLAAVFVSSSEAVYRENGPTGPIPGKFIVKLKSNVRLDVVSKGLSKGNRLEPLTRLQMKPQLIKGAGFERVHIFYTDSKAAAVADVKSMLGESNVEYVEPDYHLEFFAMPDDEFFDNQWYLYNEGQSYLGIFRREGTYNDTVVFKSGLADVDLHMWRFYWMPPAETTKVVVAIVDTGVDLLHPELEGRLWVNADEIPGNLVDDDHNGFVDDTLGYDVSGDVQTLFNPIGDNDPTDEVGHGTHIAGIIAANSNPLGVAGVAPFAKIMAVKIRPNATTAVGVAGIIYAVNAGAQVINISWGTPFESGLLQEAMEFARLNGVFVAVAPGNTGDNTRFFPAAYDSTFTVAAGHSSGNMTDFSTWGAHVDIVAPGLDILSLRAEGTDMYAAIGEPDVRIVGEDSLYYLADGTSMAAPMVVGAAAFLRGTRPDLSLAELEEILRMGAIDLLDPLDQGDTLVGPDTISGYGYLDLSASYDLLWHGGIQMISPIRRQRYTEDFSVRIAGVVGYEGSWQLDFSIGQGSDDWQYLASGGELPPDSVAFLFDDPTLEGFINFKLTDQYGNHSFTNCVHVRSQKLEITSPQTDDELKYHIPIIGSAYGPDFDSMFVAYRKQPGPFVRLDGSTGEYFDSLLFDWSVSGVDTGLFRVYLYGYFASGLQIDSATIQVVSAFADGWPRSIAGRPGVTAACADLNRDGVREIVIPTSAGLYMFDAHGDLVEGYPVADTSDVRCVPAIYDVDRDGQDEIICTSRDGLHVFKYDGSYADGWPVEVFTGQIPFGYAYPNMTVTQLGIGEDSAIVLLNKIGQIMAYEFNGDPYFYSLGGLFASFDPRISDSYSHGGPTSPFVTSTDLNGDGLNEVVASYSSPEPSTGLGLFDARTGLPAYDMLAPTIESSPRVYGTAVGDLTDDGLPEVVVLGRDSLGDMTMWVKTNGVDDLPGWPVKVPGVELWIGSYPILADLDLDRIPEILCTFFEYDIASLYIYRSDGSPYIDDEAHNGAAAFTEAVTFGTPTVANLTGDEFPEIMIRAGHILPGTGTEQIFILDHLAQPLPDWPVATPTRPTQVFSSRYAPLVDDLDGDGLVELIIVSDGLEILVWDFDAAYDDGLNTGRFLVDNRNSGILPPSLLPTGVDDEPTRLPVRATLSQNYPNPFNPVTNIEFSLPRSTHVDLRVFNILGQEVRVLLDRQMQVGEYSVPFDATGLSTGVYLYRMKTSDKTMTRKMVLVK
ncbi:MAG: S8 family peptidase [candidate division Zixibacteria bacterium]|nr:S8 family peptidase [candidate division Zixibacteria bacterium]